MKTKIVYLLFVLISFSCANSENNEQKPPQLKDFELKNRLHDKKFTLSPVRDIIVPIDSNSLNHSIFSVCYQDKETVYFITGNEYLNSIDFYDLSKKQLVKRNIYDRSGPEGIASTRVFAVANLDTILIYHDKSQLFLRTNFNGEVIEKRNPRLRLSNYVSFTSPLIYFEGKLLFYYADPSHSYQKEGVPLFVIYDWIKKESALSQVGYPDFLHETQAFYFPYQPVYTLNKQTIVYRHAFSNLIYTYHIPSGTKESYPLTSKLQEAPVYPFDTKDPSEVSDYDVNLGRDEYFQVLYDSYRDVYYSVFIQKLPKFKADDTPYDYEERPISIIIADSQFRYMGEYVLPPKTHFGRNFMVHPEGLLSIKGSALELGDEDKIIFTLLKLEELP